MSLSRHPDSDMASPSNQTRSHTYDSITTSVHVGSCVKSAPSDRIPLALSQDQKTSDSIRMPDTVRSAIAPADHGKAAWLFLAGCFLTEGLIWGKYFHLQQTFDISVLGALSDIWKRSEQNHRKPCTAFD